MTNGGIVVNTDSLAIAFQKILPKRLLTEWAGQLAQCTHPTFVRLAIQAFVRRYKVDMTEAAFSDPSAYASFNDFFSRPLKEGARPLACADYVCPVDGAISQCGPITLADRLIQAKGHDYSVRALIGGDEALARPFYDGQFATIYLSPKDYHRIHMPCQGELTHMIHVPGRLFSVNPTTTRHLPDLFARNERLVCLFRGANGPFAIVLVGATIVGSIATVWQGTVNPPRMKASRAWRYDAGEVTLAQGAEMGRFLLGSTVILLFSPDQMRFRGDWAAEKTVRMGETMGDVFRPAALMAPEAPLLLEQKPG
jgi:phosphatidylserine decarboxylase